MHLFRCGRLHSNSSDDFCYENDVVNELIKTIIEESGISTHTSTLPSHLPVMIQVDKMADDDEPNSLIVEAYSEIYGLKFS